MVEMVPILSHTKPNCPVNFSAQLKDEDEEEVPCVGAVVVVVLMFVVVGMEETMLLLPFSKEQQLALVQSVVAVHQ
jgi:hypothetical protein